MSASGRPVPVDLRARFEALRRWSELLDNAFRVPGTRLTFGWDPILGLVPWVGDVLSGIFSSLLLFQAFQMGIPRVVQVRLVLNVLIDAALGAVPVLGDLFDFAWKSNAMNLRLLERHAVEVRRARASDWAFVMTVILALVAAATVPLVLLAWIAHRLAMRFS